MVKNGKYEVAVAHNKEDAVDVAVLENKVKRSEITHVGKATSRGRLFKYPF